MISSTVSAGDNATAAQYNNLRLDVVKNAGDFAVTTGSADAYVLALDAVIATYVQGYRFRFKANFTNTGSPTLNINGVGAKTIYDAGIAAAANRIVSGRIYEVVFNSTLDGFELQTAGSLTLPPFDEATITYNDNGTIDQIVDTTLGLTFTCEYDASQKLISVTDGSNIWEIEYDSQDRVKSITLA